jgi:hypothetical protein
MATVEQILLQTGFSPEEISALDQRARAGFGQVLSAAEQARQAAELAQRSNVQFYEETIQPALIGWDDKERELQNRIARAEAESAYYRTQNENARTAGFVPSDAPGFQPRDGKGQYVASNSGSPVFTGDLNDLTQRAGQAIGILSDLQWRHQSLFNAPMPISPTELVKEADRAGVDPVTFADRKFGFSKREAELQTEKAKRHDDQIRKETEAVLRREFSERTGSNPDLRVARSSALAEVSRGVKAGQRPDPLAMSDSQRQQATRASIHQRILENQEAS